MTPARRLGGIAALCLGARAAALAACPPAAGDGRTIRGDGVDLAWRAVARDGHPLAADRIPMAEHLALEIQVCAGGTASLAPLAKVDATMPEHRHGMNYRPRIMSLGDGRWRAEGMMFHMSGRWQLEFELGADGRNGPRLFDDFRIR